MKELCWSYVHFFTFVTFDYVDYDFWVAAEVFIYSELGFLVLKKV